MAFELKNLSLADTFVMPLKNPETNDTLLSDVLDASGKPKPVTITLYGSASKQYRNAVAAMQNRALKRQQKKDKPSVEVLTEEGVSLLVQCTASVSELSVGGKIPVSEQDFHDLYSAPDLSWVKDQVDAALGDISNFLPQ